MSSEPKKETPPKHLRGDAADSDSSKKEKPWYRNSWLVFGALVAAALAFRFLVFEAFKIPTGSMEPTLIGDNNYGDRLFVYKMAYMFGRNPKRWDVAVFKPPDNARVDPNRAPASRFVKRVCGLPGDDLMVFAGDLWTRNRKTGKYEILRKPKNIQEILWYPAWKFPADSPRDMLVKFSRPGDREKEENPSDWIALSETGCSVTGDGEIILDARVPAASVESSSHPERVVEIQYAHPVTNLYVKRGRHFFNDRTIAEDTTPATPFEGSFNRYVRGGWESVVTPPNKKYPKGRRLFPLRTRDFFWGRMSPETIQKFLDTEHASEPDKASGHVGGGNICVADIRVEIEFRALIPAGSMELTWRESPRLEEQTETGTEIVSDFAHGFLVDLSGGEARLRAWHVGPFHHRARHRRDGISGDVKSFRAPVGDGKNHTIIFEHVDGALHLVVDGNEIDWEYPRDQDCLTTMAEVEAWLEKNGGEALTGPGARGGWRPELTLSVKGGAVLITRLNIYRDLFYVAEKEGRRGGFDEFRKDDSWWRNGLMISLSKGQYAMFGDNSPSSFDSRSWGPVDRKAFKGRAVVRWWPVTRWGLIR